MEISVSDEAFVFLAMVLCGFVCGFVFDFFRALRRCKQSGRKVIASQDILFWLIELTLVYGVLFELNYAHIRAYEAIALVMGSSLYFMTLSHSVILFIMRIIKFIFCVLKKMLSPIYALFKKISGIFLRLKNSVAKSLDHIKTHLMTRWRNIADKVALKTHHIEKAKKYQLKNTKIDIE